jgi:F0F1-type ATP synthase membrane subunit b/b'
MSKQSSTRDADRIDAAFNRVLAAEAEARTSVDECRQEAARIVAAATVRARAIAGLTDRRMGLARRIADRGVARAMTQLKDEARARAIERAVAAGPGRIDRVVDALADEIIGVPTGGA